MADRARGWPIAREGLPFLAAAAAPGIAAWALGWTVAGSLFGAVVLFTGWFFRNPPRRVPDGPKPVAPPGDGRVRAVGEQDEPRFRRGRGWRVTAFLTPRDGQINRPRRAGLGGVCRYSPGGTLAA